MKTKYSLMAVMTFMSATLTAQETYQDTKLIDNDLNGTARYVGMGGALEALGADISTISTNPAGIGLFRSGQVAMSGGLVAQQGVTTTPSFNNIHTSINGNKTNASFDQIGVVYSMRTGWDEYMNFAFNYHKSRNFDQILTAANMLSHASQNKLSAMKFPYANDYNWNGVDANYVNLMAPIKDLKGKQVGMDYLDGTAYVFGQYQKGYIGEYSFNLSGNLNNRVFLGLTFDLHDVNYRGNSYYTENLEHKSTLEMWEDLCLDGIGIDAKVGAIFLPMENSPFRIGGYVHTPVTYNLHLSGANAMTMSNAQDKADKDQSTDYRFKVYTPWKFGLSLGHTIGRVLALGATYEYADYGTIDNQVNNGDYYDPADGGFYDDSYSDRGMNSHTKATLKGVSTVKLGMEYKPLPSCAVRLGYNYLSPMFSKDGFRDGSISSPGNAYATSTDYTNWESTNRITCGLGCSVKKFFVDLAYQYTQTNGDFYPFMSYRSKTNQQENCIADAVKVTNRRYQVLLTLGYRF